MGGGFTSISLILETLGTTLSIGIYFMGTTKSGSPSEIFYVTEHLYCRESWWNRKTSPLFNSWFFPWSSCTAWSSWLLNTVFHLFDDRWPTETNVQTRIFTALFVEGHFPHRLINFQSVEVAQIELVIIFGQQSPILLRIRNKIAKNLIYYGAPGKFFLFHLHLL